jgi:hypothetical protein
LFQSIPWPEFTEFSSARKDFFRDFSFFLGKFYGGRKIGQNITPRPAETRPKTFSIKVLHIVQFCGLLGGE